MRKIMITVLLLAVAFGTAFSADFSKQILGKWKAYGSNCDIEGNCKDLITDESVWIRFNPDGSVDLEEKGKVQKASWTLQGDVLSMMMGKEKIALTIVSIKGNDFIFKGERRDTYQKMVRAE